MTGEQGEWLRSNPRYRAVTSRLPTGARYINRGMLHADGTFEAIHRGMRPNVRVGSFEVGIFEMTPGPEMKGPM